MLSGGPAHDDRRGEVGQPDSVALRDLIDRRQKDGAGGVTVTRDLTFHLTKFAVEFGL